MSYCFLCCNIFVAFVVVAAVDHTSSYHPGEKEGVIRWEWGLIDRGGLELGSIVIILGGWEWSSIIEPFNRLRRDGNLKEDNLGVIR